MLKGHPDVAVEHEAWCVKRFTHPPSTIHHPPSTIRHPPSAICNL